MTPTSFISAVFINATFGSRVALNTEEMKRILSCFFFCLAAMPMMSDGIVKQKFGDASVLERRAEAFVVFDYSATEVEDKGKSLDDYVEEKGYKFETTWEQAQVMAHKDFIKQFNKKSSGLTLTADSVGGDKLRLHIAIKSIDMGNLAKSLIPFGSKKEGGISLTGEVTISDNKGGKLCVLDFYDIQGLGSTTLQTRMIYAYQALRSALIKVTKKQSVIPLTDSNENAEKEKGVKEEKILKKSNKSKKQYSEDECVD